jgi:hypothetical protein
MEALAREDREGGVEYLVAALVAAKIRSTPGTRHVVLGSPCDAVPQELHRRRGCAKVAELADA